MGLGAMLKTFQFRFNVLPILLTLQPTIISVFVYKFITNKLCNWQDYTITSYTVFTTFIIHISYGVE